MKTLLGPDLLQSLAHTEIQIFGYIFCDEKPLVHFLVASVLQLQQLLQSVGRSIIIAVTPEFEGQ
jgi:hypothetical protein